MMILTWRFALQSLSFSRMRSKGSRFTLCGGLGVEGVFARRCVHGRNRPQPFATVRNCPHDCYMGKFCRRGAFCRFQKSRCFVSRGARGTSWHSDVFCNVSKVVCVAGAILLRHFQKMCCIFRGRRSTLDVSCCLFFVNRIGRAASSGDKVQIPWQAWHFVRCAENWRRPRTKHRLQIFRF